MHQETMRAELDALDDLDRVAFLAVEERLSFCLAAERLGLSEEITKKRFFRACLALQKDANGRERVRLCMRRMRDLV